MVHSHVPVLAGSENREILLRPLDLISKSVSPELNGLRMLYSRHNRLRILGLNPLDSSSLVGRDSMPGEVS